MARLGGVPPSPARLHPNGTQWAWSHRVGRLKMELVVTTSDPIHVRLDLRPGVLVVTAEDDHGKTLGRWVKAQPDG